MPFPRRSCFESFNGVLEATAWSVSHHCSLTHPTGVSYASDTPCDASDVVSGSANYAAETTDHTIPPGPTSPIVQVNMYDTTPQLNGSGELPVEDNPESS